MTTFDDVLQRARARLPAAAADAPVRPLREIRRAAFLSIADLSERSGVSTKTIVETELGRSLPQFRTIKKLSAALGAPPATIAEFVAETKSTE